MDLSDDENSSVIAGGWRVNGPILAAYPILIAFDMDTKLQQWKFDTGDWISSSPAIASGVIYVGSEDGKFYALDINTGKELWAYDTEAMITSSPAVDNGVVFVGSHNGTLYAFE